MLNDLKLLSILAGKLSNFATYFTTLVKVNQGEANDYKKSFGISPKNIWKPFAYSERVEESTKVETTRNLIKKEKCFE